MLKEEVMCCEIHTVINMKVHDGTYSYKQNIHSSNQEISIQIIHSRNIEMCA